MILKGVLKRAEIKLLETISYTLENQLYTRIFHFPTEVKLVSIIS